MAETKDTTSAYMWSQLFVVYLAAARDYTTPRGHNIIQKTATQFARFAQPGCTST